MSVRIVEVGPRDGLQNEAKILPTEVKAEFVTMLLKAGFKTIETTSFVRADKIPQMADAVALMNDLKQRQVDFKRLTCLVPNTKGLENAIDLGVKEIAVFTATSEAFNKKNINASIDESLGRISAVCAAAKSAQIQVRGYVSTVFGCPYEGQTSLETLTRVTQKLFDLGCYEVSLGDTIGIGHPQQVKEIYEHIKKRFAQDKIAWHFHDTRGMALANIYAAWQEGARIFDSSAGGLGGCPYALGASGNVASEDVVQLFNSMGIETGIDFNQLAQAAAFILTQLGRSSASKAHQAWRAEQE